MDEGAFHSPKVYAIKNIWKKKIKGVQYNSVTIDTPYQNKDFNYEQKMKMYADAYEEDGKRRTVVFQDVVDLINGKRPSSH